jgi:3-hydroxy-9,10-secoandrosta-1,3,5(10)-triene-9,17-dione monooxygenase reductase component
MAVMMQLSADEFRRALSHLTTGVCVVAAFERDRPVGMAVNSVTSASLVPPLVLVYPARTSTTSRVIRAAGEFCLSVLASHHRGTCKVFSARCADRFAGVGWHRRVRGPALDEAVAWLDCSIEIEYVAGDHTIVVTAVTGVEASEPTAEPLVFFRGRYGSFVEPDM